MWFWRGAQSAAFYYVTCTPCADAAYRRKRKTEAARSQREKAKVNTDVVTDQPRPFAQPIPFTTNEAWREEIALGPGPPPKRAGHRPNHRRVESWDATIARQDGLPEGSHGLKAESTHKKDRNGIMHSSLGDRWNRLRYQREDEPLWGEDCNFVGSSVGISGRGKAGTEDSNKYFSKVPPVNDLHPPIVHVPRSKSETRWMLQPPPSAKVMAGKEVSSYLARANGGVVRDRSLHIGVRNEATNMQPDRSAKQPHEAPLLPSIPSPTLIDGTTQKVPSRTTSLKDRQSLPADDVRRSPRPHLALAAPPPSYHGHRDSRGTAQQDSPTSTLSGLDDSSGMRSPTLNWQYPDTPVSRPTSNPTIDVFRPTIAKHFSTIQRDPKSRRIQMFSLEISDDGKDDVDFSHIERVRPWRWSMDI